MSTVNSTIKSINATDIPRYTSIEENRALLSSTPTSFADIPPVLLHKEDSVNIVLDPPVEGFSTPQELAGTLYILNSALIFMSSVGHGFQIQYPSITLHAISHKIEPGPYIYCQIDEPSGKETEEVVGEDELGQYWELKIFPTTEETKENSLEGMFLGLSTAAAMNPDAPLEDEFDQSDNFDTVDDEQEMSELGRHTLEYLQSILVYPDGDPSSTEVDADENAFEDADEQQKHGDEVEHSEIDLDGRQTNGAEKDETT